ncbi:ABC transporter permease [Natranaerobius thermophilus]|uniref:Binding-protein-dependent transport systems inner membrane component n=1 Tax=Natranaerobius thermophilus (strain ATCC BAA-1301 / DSM 18059 / JW/NM-WN-LF) TaxID=457570 RepID=B2A291_NATTJ|nr:ABC transporter permease [Natranaerobius thermophilus]ACB86197.1 binding-protein-dependent transport systems inner membrane component [Natranaerobius thermophilus JW/NM-WN-LF]
MEEPKQVQKQGQTQNQDQTAVDKPSSILGDGIRQFAKNKLAVISFGVVILFILMGIFAPHIAPSNEDPIEPVLQRRLQPGIWEGNSETPLGTDSLGRDILTRLIYGAQISLRVGYVVIGITAVFGITIGLIAGYFGGKIDMIFMRFIDIMLSFPPLLLALVVVAILGAGLENAMLAIALVYIPQVARVVRSSVLKVREMPYIEACRAMGGSNFWIIISHVLPNILASAVVYLTLLLGDAILYTAALGFLGIGIDPATPEWGAMLSDGRDYLLVGGWWVTLFPGVMIALTVLSFNLFGDGLREAFDPKMDL